jgi:hypothetical protein
LPSSPMRLNRSTVALSRIAWPAQRDPCAAPQPNSSLPRTPGAPFQRFNGRSRLLQVSGDPAGTTWL